MALGSLAGNWNLEPVQLALMFTASLAYLRRTRTLARRGTPVAGWRRAIFWLGIALVIVALNSPIDAIAEDDLFFVHMVQHVILSDLAPLCFIVGLTGPVLRPVLAFRVVERMRVLAHPLVALPLWAVSLLAWHVPFLYEAALDHTAVHILEHTMFFTFGALMWAPILETLPGPMWFGTGMKAAYILVVRAIMTILGNVFIWSTTAFYPRYDDADRTWGLTALQDQNYAGVVMMGEGSAVTIVALAWLFLRMASEGELRQRLIEQGIDPVMVKRAVRYGRGEALERDHGRGAGRAPLNSPREKA
jgi:putative membrane protein